MPCRTYFTKTKIPNKLKNINEKLYEILSKADNITLTSEIWVSNSQDSYLSITCSFL